MTQNNAQTPRRLAFELLIKTEKAKQYSNIALDKALEASALSDVDRRLASALFYGIIEKKLTLDYRISQLSQRPLSDIDAQTACAIRLGLYQLIFMEKIPPHAAINESVSLVSRKSSGFVNAILRSHTRSPMLSFPAPTKEPIEYLSTAYSVCPELCAKFTDTFGFERTESIFKAISVPVATTLRVNTLKITRDELAERITAPASTSISPHGLKVCGAVRNIYGFDDGLFFVQDEASQICVEALDARPDMTVMDICSCPGSKSFGAAISMENRGQILSYDLHENKLSLILEGARRLGIDIIKVEARDGRSPINELFGKADRVLCDVPCSGFGVLAKKPELRYKNPVDSASLPDIQLSILENACNYVRDGGSLVYSTCTVFPEENEQNVQRFLQKHKDFVLTPFSVGTLSVPSGYITLMPDTHGTDGFFIAKLTKRNDK